MNFIPITLQGSYVIELQPFVDDRGWFVRTFCKNEFAAIKHNAEWVQINHSFTQQKGTIRGMHYQLPPYKEIKMVRCVVGKVWDVIIDLRKNSPTFLQWAGVELSAENKKMFYIPAGFAHGFQTLTNNCELIYHHSQFYNPHLEGGIRYDDPVINIKWLQPPSNISERDKQHPLLDNHFKGI